jgi:hypothetical protein
MKLKFGWKPIPMRSPKGGIRAQWFALTSFRPADSRYTWSVTFQLLWFRMTLICWKGQKVAHENV